MAKILVADDNSNIQKMVGLALKDQGIEVVAVGNGEAAVRKISDLRPDLVLADVFMPVRSGYEVCSYVKQDPTLAHIPVILLVGAFDPLDEQEAQRVGADGVLKKPFVPPDPLISMVKSALARAGVSLGTAPAIEKAPEVPKRNAADILSPAASKLAALAPPKFPEAEPEPLPEDLPSFVTEVRIEAGQEPVAFGSLLETPEVEDDAAFIPTKPPTEIGAAHTWEKNDVEEEEEEEEESGASKHGWRPGGDLNKSLGETTVAKEPDWREEGFHGNSPGKPHRSQRWAPNVAEPAFAEASGSQAVAVSTLEQVKPAETPAFSGDAWAAAMAAGVEEKIAETHGSVSKATEAETVAEAKQEIAQLLAHHAPEPVSQTESATAGPWELEAKKANQLASTWDSVAAEPAPTASNHSASVAEEPAIETSATQEPVYDAAPVHEAVTESAQEPSADRSFGYAHVEIVPEPLTARAETHVNETQEIEAYREPNDNHQESTWVATTPEVLNQFVETPAQEFAPTPAPEPVAEAAAEAIAEVVPQAAQPNMDDLVARVLSRMNPDILQKVTRDILKPVIEAIIQDELNSQKQ